MANQGGIAAKTWSEAEVDMILRRMTERLRLVVGGLSEEELTGISAMR